MASAVLATVETFDGERIVIIRERDEHARGRTVMRIERFDRRSREWTTTSTRVVIPNSAVFLVADAMNRSCELAGGDRR